MIDILPNRKAAPSERYTSRARQKSPHAPVSSDHNLQVQYLPILSGLRVNKATLDTGLNLTESEYLGVPLSIVDRAHAPSSAGNSGVPAAGRKASNARTPTLKRNSHQTVYTDYANCTDGQSCRLGKKQKSHD